MNVSRRLRAGGAIGHLLLVVVLALGVFVMHTVGHPDGSAGSGMSPAAHKGTAASTHGDPAVVMADDVAGATGLSATMTDNESGMPDTVVSATEHSDMGMDVMELCVAVLGGWVLAALLYAALVGRADWSAPLLRRVLTPARRGPPPRGPTLAQLSVLRI